MLGEIVSDMLLRGPMTRFADSRIDAAAPTFVYEFRWRSPVDRLGAAHAMELGFVFDALGIADAVALGGTDAPQQLADAMHGAWVAFVDRRAIPVGAVVGAPTRAGVRRGRRSPRLRPTGG